MNAKRAKAGVAADNASERFTDYGRMQMAEEIKGSNTEKDPEEWVTGEEPMTGAQASYLNTLSQEAGVEFPHDLTKAEASKRIEELQDKTGRGN